MQHSSLLLFSGLGWVEILIILGVVLLLFGAKRIPEIARSLGKGIKEFKKGLSEEEEKKEGEDQSVPRKNERPTEEGRNPDQEKEVEK